MSGVNKAIIVGNLGQDPETRFMPSGGAVTNISVATSESWKDKQTGEQKEKTEWHRVVIFGPIAEYAGEYLRKGSKVYVEGKLQTRKWQDNSGMDRYTTEIVVQGFGSTIQFLDSRNQGQQQGGFQGQQQPQRQQGGFNQHQAPQQQGMGFHQQSGHVTPMQNNPPRNEMSAAQKQHHDQQLRMSAQQQHHQGGKVQPQEPKIDFDDDIPF